MSYLTNYEEIDGGYVAFGGNPKEGKIIGKGTKDETSGILMSFLTRIENLVDHKVKAEAVNTACYMQNRVSAVKPHSKTPYELFRGKFNGKANEGFFVGYSLNSKAIRVFNSRTRIVEENLHIRFSESTPNVVGTKASDNAGQSRKETAFVKYYILLPLWTTDLPFSQDPKSTQDDGFKPSDDDGKKVDEDPRQESECKDQEKQDNVNNTNTVNAASTNRDEDDDAMADMSNLDTTIQVSPTPTIRFHKDHHLDQVIGDLHSATQIRNMSNNLEEHGFVCTIQQRTNHKDLQNYLFACFLSQEEPKKVIHALKDLSWIEAMQEELL
nr:hypothetical protein [Tanacetum cinerariifolium]